MRDPVADYNDDHSARVARDLKEAAVVVHDALFLSYGPFVLQLTIASVTAASADATSHNPGRGVSRIFKDMKSEFV